MNRTPSPWARPATLAEVAIAAGSREDFHSHLRDFLHEFKTTPRRDRVLAEPPLLCKKFAGGEIADAYLAAVAVELCLDLGWAKPTWVNGPERTVPQPWFAAKSDELRIILLHESPAGFRERNLFVSENALSVA